MDEAAAAAPEPERVRGAADGRTSRRGFVREVGVIVLGVLIALAIGEAADAVRRQARLAQTRERMDAELRRNLGVFEERIMITRCLEARIAALRVILNEARRTGELPSIGEIGFSPVRPVNTVAWEGAVGGGVTLDMSVAELNGLTATYSDAAMAPQEMLKEWEAWGQLRAVEAAPGRISDDLLAGMLAALSAAERGTLINEAIAEQNAAVLRARGLRPDYYPVAGPGMDEHKLRKTAAGYRACRPLMVDGRAWTPPGVTPARTPR